MDRLHTTSRGSTHCFVELDTNLSRKEKEMRTFLMAVVTLVLSATAFATSAAAEDRSARAWPHINYGGTKLKIEPGKVWIADDSWNDRISSLRVDEGCILTVREHRHKKDGVRVLGDLHRFDSNSRNLKYVRDRSGKDWNDRISLMLLRCY